MNRQLHLAGLRQAPRVPHAFVVERFQGVVPEVGAELDEVHPLFTGPFDFVLEPSSCATAE